MASIDGGRASRDTIHRRPHVVLRYPLLALALSLVFAVSFVGIASARIEARLLDCSYAAGQLDVELKTVYEVEYLGANGAPWAPVSPAFYSEDLWGSDDELVDCSPEVTGPFDSMSVRDPANVPATFTTRALGPGETPEVTGQSEFELYLDLGSAPNTFHLYHAVSYLSIVSPYAAHTNTDADVDISLAPGVTTWSISGVGVMNSALGRGFTVRVMASPDANSVQLGASADRVYGRGGDDFLRTAGGMDWINGGAGRDVLRAGSGDDELVGGGRNDTLYGGNGNDTLWAYDGANDFVQCGPGYDTVASSDPGDHVTSDCEVRL